MKMSPQTSLQGRTHLPKHWDTLGFVLAAEMPPQKNTFFPEQLIASEWL